MNAAALAMRAGVFAEEPLLGGPPRVALASGFRFTYPGADEALAAILGRVRKKRDRRNNGRRGLVGVGGLSPAQPET